MIPNLKLKRHDLSDDGTLRPWSAADEYVLATFNELEKTGEENIGIYHDRFGFLACHLHAQKPTIVSTNRSQEKAINQNLSFNKLEVAQFEKPLDALSDKVDLVLLKIPKSLDLFDLFLHHIASNSTKNVKVLCGFMTRHFSPKMLEIASKYFENVEQSKAFKKSRIITLSDKKEIPEIDLINEIDYEGQKLKQYASVFSADHIDYATQFLLKNIKIESTQTILDLGSGNGVIAHALLQQSPESTVHLMDDLYLATESGKLNLDGENVKHHYENDLAMFSDNSFDLIVTNPPFHFEHDINIQVPISLFKNSVRCLKPGATLHVVANKHLNYKTHLDKIFTPAQVVVLAENDKFIAYTCTKSE